MIVMILVMKQYVMLYIFGLYDYQDDITSMIDDWYRIELIEDEVKMK